jgi:N-acetylglucosamine kinase-like BadF-type ATPase
VIPQTARGGRADGDGVVVGIDAGGSSTRVRALLRGATIYEGTGGPGNPLMADQETIRASYHAALAGCPDAARIAAGVSGARSGGGRAQITELLASRFPGAKIRVEPDYVTAFLAASPATDVCVVAGTGSVVCSRSADGSYPVSGGHGWILGDHGGAARLGRAALEHFVADHSEVPGTFAAAIRQAFGDNDPRFVVRALHAAPNPAPLLARFAPLLTAAAENKVRWACAVLDAEMLALAGTVARHIDQHLPRRPTVHIALAGGVWESLAARSGLNTALERAGIRGPVVARSLADPIDGAVRLTGDIA